MNETELAEIEARAKAKLRPCPFCGNIPQSEHLEGIHTTESGQFIWCPTCNRSFIYDDKGGKGRDIWNTRPTEDVLLAEVRRLRTALHHIGYQSAAMSTVDFDWHDEWMNLRTEARAALNPPALSQK